MRFKFLLLLAFSVQAQNSHAEERNYIQGEWRYITSWDIGTSNGQSQNNSTEQAAIGAAMSSINSDSTTCSAASITGFTAWELRETYAGQPTYQVRYPLYTRGRWSFNNTTCDPMPNSISEGRNREITCPVGYIPNPNNGYKTCFAPDTTPKLDKSDFPQCDTATQNQSKPIHSGLGYMVETETDFSSTGWGLSFNRYYTSVNNRASGLLGNNWRHSYERSLSYINNTDAGLATVVMNRPNKGREYFTLVSGVWTADAGFNERLVHNAGGGWLYTDNNDNKELYTEEGQLLSIEDRNGRVIALQYQLDQLIAVVDDQGRALTFVYQYFANINDVRKTRLTAVGLPDGQLISYQYDSNGMLERAVYPDATPLVSTDNPYRRYQYGNGSSAKTYQLIGLFDERGTQYMNWQYDSSDRAISSEMGAPGSLIEKVSFVFNTDGSSIVTNPKGQARTYNFGVVNGVQKITSMIGACPACGANFAARTYDINGRVDIETDFANTTTDTDYDARGLLMQKIESANKAATKRTTQTLWHSSFRVPTERNLLNANNVLESKTKYAYNARGQKTAVCQIDTTNGAAMNYVCGSAVNAPAGVRQGSSTYCEQDDVSAGACPMVGLILTNNGPRTDVSDISTFTYRMVDESTCASSPNTCAYRKGDLWKITNALNQVSEYTAYDGAGRVLQHKDINGVVTDFEYQARGWLTARKIRGADDGGEYDDSITRMEYDAAGQISKVIQADGEFIELVYDTARRLTGIQDAANNSITYTLDAEGNRIKEETFNNGGTLTHTLSRVYDTLSRLQAKKNATNVTTISLTYDANDNVDTSTDGLNRVADQDVDALNRLIKIIQDKGAGKLNVTTQYQYDARDNLTKVIDPKSLDTNYSYNGLDDLTQLSSPDAGATTYTYDAAGNRKSQTDAKSVVSNYGYDALNRLTLVSYPSASTLTSNFSYDAVNAICGSNESFAKGHLSKLTDASGNTQYCYDRFGNLTRKQQTNNGLVRLTTYEYTLGGRISRMVYPSGNAVTYNYNSIGRVHDVNVIMNGSSTSTVLANRMIYSPFGPLIQAGQYLVKCNSVGGGGAFAFSSLGDGGDQGEPVDCPQGKTLQVLRSWVFARWNHNLDFDITGLQNTAIQNDNQGNIIGLTDADLMSYSYQYDGLNRLKLVKNDTTNQIKYAFSYDATGNRISKTIDTAPPQTYTYGASNHRLASVAGESRTYDSNGNSTQISSNKRFTYDARNRIVDFRTGVGVFSIVSQYQYNGKGERVRKYKNTIDQARYMYSESGQLINEESITGGVTTSSDIVWVEDKPIAVLRDGASYIIEADHLGTPRGVYENTTTTRVWSWVLNKDAFGETAPDTDPDANSNEFIFNLRFPGQLYDKESGLLYNYFRDYDAGTGRYIQSDPVGLDGGFATFAYVYNSPMNSFDRYGLQTAWPVPTKNWGYGAPPGSCQIPGPGNCAGKERRLQFDRTLHRFSLDGSKAFGTDQLQSMRHFVYVSPCCESKIKYGGRKLVTLLDAQGGKSNTYGSTMTEDITVSFSSDDPCCNCTTCGGSWEKVNDPDVEDDIWKTIVDAVASSERK